MEVVTLSKKCKSWTARNIALAVSEKAFEHLEAPSRAAIRKVYEECVQKIEHDTGTTTEKLSLYRLAKLHSQAGMTVTTNDGANELRLYVNDGEDVWRFNAADGFTLVRDDALHAKLEAIQQAHAPILRKKEALADEIKKQITDKSYKAILKEWPELSDIIRTVVDIQDTNSTGMTVPFESLLSRFLPALPAPEGASA